MDTGLDTVKTASKKVAQKESKFIRNKTADAVTISRDEKIMKPEPVEEIIIPLEKRDKKLDKLRKVS